MEYNEVVFGRDAADGPVARLKLQLPELKSTSVAEWRQWSSTFAVWIRNETQGAVDLGDGTLGYAVQAGWATADGRPAPGLGQLDEDGVIEVPLPWNRANDVKLRVTIEFAIGIGGRALVTGINNGLSIWLRLCAHFSESALQSHMLGHHSLMASGQRFKAQFATLNPDEWENAFSQHLAELIRIEETVLEPPAHLTARGLFGVLAVVNGAPEIPAVQTWLQSVLQGTKQYASLIDAGRDLHNVIKTAASMHVPVWQEAGQQKVALAAVAGGEGKPTDQTEGKDSVVALLKMLVQQNQGKGARSSNRRACWACGDANHVFSECKAKMSQWKDPEWHVRQGHRLNEADKAKLNKMLNESSKSAYQTSRCDTSFGATLRSIALFSAEEIEHAIAFDTGASGWLVRDKRDLYDYKSTPRGKRPSFAVGNKTSLEGIGVGQLQLSLRDSDGDHVSIHSGKKDAIHAPNLPVRMLIGRRALEKVGVFLLADGEGGPWLLHVKQTGQKVPLEQRGDLTVLVPDEPREGPSLAEGKVSLVRLG